MAQTNISVTTARTRDYFFLLLGLPILASAFLIPFAIINHSLFVNSSLAYELGTACGYVIALSLACFILRKTLRLSGLNYAVLVIFISALIQMMWRVISAGFEHIDCGDNCDPSIIPQTVDSRATKVTLVALVISMVVILILLFKNRTPATF
jgi:hypothetical protein